MNADDFYEHFKDALKFLGVGWGEMDQVIVNVVDGKFVMTTAQKSCILVVEEPNE